MLTVGHIERAGYKDAILKLGVLYCQQRQYDLALSMLERDSQIDVLDPDLIALLKAGQLIIKTHGCTSLVLTPLFESYIGSSDQIDELIAGFVTNLGISPNLNDIMAIVEKGGFPRENLETLLSLFQEYTTTFPGYADIYNMVGILFQKLNLAKDAERCFDKLIHLNPNYIKARLNLFNLLKDQKRFSEAIEQGYFLERFNLPYPDLYCGMAETLLGLARYSDARRFAQKAISINPTYPKAQQVMQQIDSSIL